MNIVAIHQPDFLPYLGFFHKFYFSDIFILYDTAQYTKRGWHNRNLIKTERGAEWLTVPVSLNYQDPINEVCISNNYVLAENIKKLRIHYGNTPFAHKHLNNIIDIYGRYKSGDRLVDLNVSLLQYFFNLIKPEVEVVFASKLKFEPTLKGTDAILAMVREVKADAYLSGVGGRNYMDERLFSPHSEIKLLWQKFSASYYSQKYEPFIPNLSIIDVLLNVGEFDLKNLLSTCSDFYE